MKIYEVPKLDILFFSGDDVITSSNTLNHGTDWTPEKEEQSSIDGWLQ